MNDTRKRAMGRTVITALDGEAKDSMRERRRARNPEGMEIAKGMMPEVAYCRDAYEAATGADAVVIVTEWDIYHALDLKRLASTMNAPVMVDLLNVYLPSDVEKAGFAYSSIGR